MEEDALQALNAHLQEPIATEQESYGLKKSAPADTTILWPQVRSGDTEEPDRRSDR